MKNPSENKTELNFKLPEGVATGTQLMIETGLPVQTCEGKVTVFAAKGELEKVYAAAKKYGYRLVQTIN